MVASAHTEVRNVFATTGRVMVGSLENQTEVVLGGLWESRPTV